MPSHCSTEMNPTHSLMTIPPPGFVFEGFRAIINFSGFWLSRSINASMLWLWTHTASARLAVVVMAVVTSCCVLSAGLRATGQKHPGQCLDAGCDDMTMGISRRAKIAGVCVWRLWALRGVKWTEVPRF